MIYGEPDLSLDSPDKCLPLPLLLLVLWLVKVARPLDGVPLVRLVAPPVPVFPLVVAHY